MSHTIVRQRDLCQVPRQRVAVYLDASDTTADSVWVLDRDVVARGVISEGDFEVSPGLRHARIKKQRRATQTNSENPLEAHTIHPSARTGVPGPSTAPDVRGLCVYVATGHVWLHLVAINRGTRTRVIYRDQERKKFTGFVPVAEHREGQH